MGEWDAAADRAAERVVQRKTRATQEARERAEQLARIPAHARELQEWHDGPHGQSAMRLLCNLSELAGRKVLVTLCELEMYRRWIVFRDDGFRYHSSTGATSMTDPINTFTPCESFEQVVRHYLDTKQNHEPANIIEHLRNLLRRAGS